jgi:hypothetical protein
MRHVLLTDITLAAIREAGMLLKDHLKNFL